MGLLINDGFTLTAKIAPRGPWPALTARFRPALPAACYEFLEASRPGAAARHSAAVKLLTAQLVSWDVTDDKGEVLAVTPANLRKLPMSYMEELINQVTGYGDAEADEKN
jgi:hypothetical protein